MQHFKFKNWRIGGLENSIFDVTNRLEVIYDLLIRWFHEYEIECCCLHARDTVRFRNPGGQAVMWWA